MSGRCHGLERLGRTKNKQQSCRAEAPGLERLGSLRERKKKGQEPGQDHPGKREQVYQNIRKEEETRGRAGTSREETSSPVMARSWKDRAAGESGQARGQPGRSRVRARSGTAAVGKEMWTKTR